MEKETPYEYHDNKLGVKLKYLIADRNKHEDSLCLFKYKTIYFRLKSKSSCEQELRRACFGQEALVLFSSLDRETKDAITIKFGDPVQEAKKSWFAKHYVADRMAFDFFVAHTYGEDNKKLKMEYIEQYTYNASVLNTVLICKTNRKEYIKAQGTLGVDIWQSLSNDVNAFREVEHNLPTTKDSLRRKVTKYQKEGYISLISGKLITKNAIKVKSKEQTALVDELIAKHNNFDNQTIADVYNSIAERLNWKTITAQTVGNRKVESNLITFAGRNGTKALSNKVLMQNKRSKPSLPMLYWTIDGWDAELLYQKTTVDKKGYSTTTYHNRLTMVVVLDPFNKYPIGYAIGTHETPELIKEAMFNAVVHTKELFGNYFKPYQLQSDNYSKKTLTPLYEACTKHYTPAKVGNAKAKVIEPYFGYINKKYCQLFDNWSGFGVASGSKNQPNDEMLNKIRHSFPDEAGCRSQLESIITTERAKKQMEFVAQWENVSTELRLPFAKENFLLTLGKTTGETNKLTGEGIKMKIDGTTVFYDSFDMNFRKLSHINWQIQYNPNDLNEAIAISPNGEYRFELERKYIQPMAIAEQTENDAMERQRIKNFNKVTTTYIIEERHKNDEVLQPLLQNPLLNDTLAKHLLTNSRGQHKDERNEPRKVIANAEKVLLKQENAIEKTNAKTWQEEQNEYINNKIDLTKYAQL
ncbi:MULTISPECIES: hypothetical protein [Flavobacterium]|uniref:hypothetical protein n=1 Tax=Flavobacterium TaxID=237 RepID=UPI000B4D8413|nr:MULTISPECIES: hypothetical protein [Flavobacterium]OWP85759.1 hypothetical protein BWK60_12425 [Flavobacterium covae]